ncbi:MAG: 50S ribosomal protein L35 [Parcubacteria group bacterium]|nr:50S ribosomal protein L35 [Parcubacteria group bacterium]
MTSKTNKSMAKRFRVTKRGKVLHRGPHQNHFRAKKSGNRIRKIRKETSMAKPAVRNILNKMPFN